VVRALRRRDGAGAARDARRPGDRPRARGARAGVAAAIWRSTAAWPAAPCSRPEPTGRPAASVGSASRVA
jgi:hypothetical protein